MFESYKLRLISLIIKGTTEMVRRGTESATFWGVVCKRAEIWGSCFGHLKIQSGTSVFHINPSHGLIGPDVRVNLAPEIGTKTAPFQWG